ncbi:MAG: hydrolase [Pirellulales bacterium]|nr:hydrolase [Pirellulales bacterium]
MSRDDTALIVIDVQGKLSGLIPGHRRIIWNIRRLIDGARLFGLPVAATEQYPQGLGPTVPELAALVDPAAAKTRFSCGECGELFAGLRERKVYRYLLCGIESHVCVQQTALDLLATGQRVYLAVDAIGARHRIDHDTALLRLEASGATMTTTEAALFEWCEHARDPAFKQLSKLIQEQAPEE